MNSIGNFSPEIMKEIEQKGYHILNTSLPKGSYPNEFSKFPTLKDIKIGEIYVLRLFVKMPNKILQNIDSGLIDVEIIDKSQNRYTAKILTLLPDFFPLSKGKSIEIKKEEILYQQNSVGHN
ncbi:hypothetical protein ACFLSQ_10030 [Bacteroidota bacterium]